MPRRYKGLHRVIISEFLGTRQEIRDGKEIKAKRAEMLADLFACKRPKHYGRWITFLAVRDACAYGEDVIRVGSACSPRFFSEEPGPQLPFLIVLTRRRIRWAGLPELEQS
jgi:hypothetical protein